VTGRCAWGWWEFTAASMGKELPVKDFLIALAVVLTITSVLAQDWPSIIRRPKKWKPPPSPHEPGRYRSEPLSEFTYRGKVYPSFQSFKASADYLSYLEDNRRAAVRFDRYLMEKERRREAAVDFFRYRHHFLASTQVWMDENDRWHELARTAWRDLGVEDEEHALDGSR
jgi:hypothetical protein